MATAIDFERLKSLVGHTAKIKFDHLGIGRLLTSDIYSTWLRGVETQYNCVIRITAGSDTELEVVTEEPSVNITVQKDDITTSKADVLVNTVAGSRNRLSGKCGAVAKAFYIAGGQELEQAYIYAGILSANEVSVTESSGSLQCQYVVHLGLPRWRRRFDDDSDSRTNLKENISKCLTEADKVQATTIAFPSIGCGNLGYSATVVGGLLTEQALIHKAANLHSTIEEIFIITSEDELVEDFKDSVDAAFKVKKLETEIANDSADFSDSPHKTVVVYVYAKSAEDAQTAVMKIQELVEQKYQHTSFDPAKEDDTISIVSHGEFAERFKEINIRKDAFGVPISMSGSKSMLLRAVSDVQLIKKDEILKQQNKHPTEVLREQGKERYIKKLSDTEIFLPMYWTQYTGKYNVVHFDPTSGDCIQEVQSDDQSYKEVEKLFQDTHVASQVGYGSDARGLTHRNMKIKKIERIENPDTFANYANYRKATCLKHLRDGPLPSVALKGDRTSGEMYEDLVTEINESYLFHGTIVDNKEAIRRQGLDPRVSGVGLFGRGIYFTDSSTKADQYTDSKHSRQPGDHEMFLSRVILGDAYQDVEGGDMKNMTRPPCKECRTQNCKTHHDIYDSLVGTKKPGGTRLLFTEFIIYEKQHCYPEYIITYERV